MKNDSQSSLTLAVVFAALVIGGSLVYLGYQMSSGGFSDDKVAAVVDEGDKDTPPPPSNNVTAPYDELVDDDAFIGDEDAPVTLIEFSDYECPYCGRHFNQTVPSLKKDYVDTGKLKMVFRDFPLGFHAAAVPAAMAAECAGDQKGDDMYFQMHDKIFAGQKDFGSGINELVTGYASELGLNAADFKSCMDSEKFKDEIQADMTAGSSFGVRGTPGFVLTDGETSTLISGAQAFASFKAKIDGLLDK